MSWMSYSYNEEPSTDFRFDSDPFDLLAPEIILEILKKVDDFVGLQGLITASAYINRVFNAHACEVLTAVLAANPITAEPKVRQVFCRIALLHGQKTVKSVREYLSLIESNAALRIPDAALASYMVNIGAQIQRLACTCLIVFLKNFHEALEASTAKTSNPIGQRKLNTAEPFSWIEEFRVYRALWNLYHYSELESGINRWGWAAKELGTFNEDIAFTGIHEDENPMYEELWQVSYALEKLGLPRSPAPAYLRLSSRPLPIFETLLNHSFSSDHVWSCPSPPNESEDDNWARTRPFTAIYSPAWVEMASGWPLELGFGSLCLQTTGALKWLGILIWDDWRMQCAGLLRRLNIGGKYRYRSRFQRLAGLRPADLVLWMSILTYAESSGVGWLVYGMPDSMAVSVGGVGQ